MSNKNQLWIGAAFLVSVIPEYIATKLTGDYGFFFLYRNFALYALLFFIVTMSLVSYLSHRLFTKNSSKELLSPIFYVGIFFGIMSFSFIVLPSILHTATSKKVEIRAKAIPGYYWKKYEYGRITVTIGREDKKQFGFLDNKTLKGIRKEQYKNLEGEQEVVIYGTMSKFAFHYLYVIPIPDL